MDKLDTNDAPKLLNSIIGVIEDITILHTLCAKLSWSNVRTRKLEKAIALAENINRK
jgi:hypothetical protein